MAADGGPVDHSPVVGFVGLGNMGRLMAANVVAAGFDLVGYDRAGSADRCPPGASAAASLEEVAARAELVVLSLPDGAASVEVASALAAIDPERRRVRLVVDTSTAGPAAATEAAALLVPAGIVYADGPVSGGTAGARAGTVSLMFAGPADQLERYRPVLAAISSNVFHIGDRPGQGQTMKLVNNFLSATAMAATAEALAFGASQGLEMTLMLDVINVSSGRNSATVDKFPNRIVPGRYDAGFSTSLMTKDVALLAGEARAAGAPRHLIEAVESRWQGADRAMPGSDFTRIWPYVRHHPDRPVVLTGFMGTGKTTVGRLLAGQLGFDFVDTDAVIEDRHGPIPAIFAHQGETAFRQIERGVAAELAGRTRVVVATGGRLMLDPANQASLGSAAHVFCLQASPEQIMARLRADPAGLERPLLAGDDPEGRVRELLAERAEGYGCFAPIATDGRSPEAIAADIATDLAARLQAGSEE